MDVISPNTEPLNWPDKTSKGQGQSSNWSLVWGDMNIGILFPLVIFSIVFFLKLIGCK